jgi:LuxR family quorum-sensing system transcriptional regulator SolR
MTLDNLTEQEIEKIIKEYNKSKAFTQKTLRIAQMLSNGLTVKEIGPLLEISHRTVESHIDKMITSMGASNRVQLIAELLRKKKIV